MLGVDSEEIPPVTEFSTEASLGSGGWLLDAVSARYGPLTVNPHEF